MHRGYVKLWRKAEDSGIMQSKDAWQLFSWLLLKASSRKRKQVVGSACVHLLPGQLIVGRKKLAADLCSSEQSIRTALKLLERMDIITQQPTPKYTVITLCNWQSYQYDMEKHTTVAPRSAVQGEVQPGGGMDNLYSPSVRTAALEAQDICAAVPLMDSTVPSLSAHARVDEVVAETWQSPAQKVQTEKKANSVPEPSEVVYITRKKRRLAGKQLADFTRFFDTFADKRGKAEAADAWLDIPELNDALLERIVQAAQRYAQERETLMRRGSTPKMAQGWLTGRRWEDEWHGSAASSLSPDDGLTDLERHLLAHGVHPHTGQEIHTL